MDCVIVGKGVDVKTSVLVSEIEFVIGSGDNVPVRSGSELDILEQDAATTNSNNKNNCLMRWQH